MSTFKKSTMMIGGVPRNVVLINYKPDPTTETKSVDTMHHIHVLDRSGSMSSSIVALMEDVKKTFRAIPVGDYISVVWFSSEGENGVVIKGYKKTEDDDFTGIDKLVDSIKSTVGCTCFYQPMDLVKSIVEEMKPMCPHYNVTLFTDGCSCCNVSPMEDYNRTHERIFNMKDDIMALNTIGYSNYYDEKFLTDAATITDFGKYSHSSHIEDYSEIFSHNYERVKDMVVDKVDILAHCCEVIYLNSKSSKLCKDEIHLSTIDKRKNQFLIILPSDNYDTIYLNGSIIYINELKETKLLPSTTINLQYALAYEYYYTGNRETCLDILAKDLRDKSLIDAHLKAFTLDETSAFLKRLHTAVYKHKFRGYASAPEDYVPAENAFCVMDLLDILCRGENYYIPDTSSYQRVGLKVEDTFNLFTPDRESKVYAPFNDNLVYHKDRLNVSIKFTRNGTVAINPKSAKRVNLPEDVQSYQFQTHTIIKDGQLHIPKITVRLSEATEMVLREVQESSHINFLHPAWTDFNEFVLDLDALPIINRSYANFSSLDNLLNTVYDITACEILQKVIKCRLDSIATIPSGNAKFLYTADQIEVLNEHGINEYGAYVGVNRKVTDKDGADYYEARELEFYIKGCSSIPTIEKALESYKNAVSKNKIPTFIAASVHTTWIGLDYKLNMEVEDKKEYLKSKLAEVRNELMILRNRLSALKIAKVLTGSWWEGLETTKDGWSYKRDDIELIIKANHKKVYFN